MCEGYCPLVEGFIHVDDEYAWAGVEDPKVVVTTSHSPSSRLKQFVKVKSRVAHCELKCLSCKHHVLQELRLMMPNAQRMNRGSFVISQLVHACKSNNVTDLIIVHEHRGEPSTFKSHTIHSPSTHPPLTLHSPSTHPPLTLHPPICPSLSPFKMV